MCYSHSFQCHWGHTAPPLPGAGQWQGASPLLFQSLVLQQSQDWSDSIQCNCFHYMQLGVLSYLTTTHHLPSLNTRMEKWSPNKALYISGKGSTFNPLNYQVYPGILATFARENRQSTVARCSTAFLQLPWWTVKSLLDHNNTKLLCNLLTWGSHSMMIWHLFWAGQCAEQEA